MKNYDRILGKKLGIDHALQTLNGKVTETTGWQKLIAYQDALKWTLED